MRKTSATGATARLRCRPTVAGQVKRASGVGRGIACMGRTLLAGRDENRRGCSKSAARAKESDRSDGDRRREKRAGIAMKNAAQRVVCVVGQGPGRRFRFRFLSIAGAVADQTGIGQSREIIVGRRWRRAKGNSRGKKLKNDRDQRDEPRPPVETPRAVVTASTRTRHWPEPILDRQGRG